MRIFWRLWACLAAGLSQPQGVLGISVPTVRVRKPVRRVMLAGNKVAELHPTKGWKWK